MVDECHGERASAVLVCEAQARGPRRCGREAAPRGVARGPGVGAPRRRLWVRRPAPPVLATVDIEHPINYSAICRVGRARRRAGAPRAGRGACLGGCTSTRRVRRRETVRVFVLRVFP